MEELNLTESERTSALWKKLSKHFQDVIDQERDTLENFKLTEEETNRIRSIIMVMRVLISLGDTAPEE